MGHYDEAYEFDYQESKKESKKSLKKVIRKLDVEEMELLHKALTNEKKLLFKLLKIFIDV